MKQGTVCFPVKDDKVLLFLIHYPDGTELWNGVGGVVDSEETLEEGLVREIKEEIGLKIDKNALKEMGTLNFPELKLTTFIIKDFNMIPQLKDPTIKEYQWFDKDKIPFDQMFPDNHKWLPGILSGQKI